MMTRRRRRFPALGAGADPPPAARSCLTPAWRGNTFVSVSPGDPGINSHRGSSRWEAGRLRARRPPGRGV